MDVALVDHDCHTVTRGLLDRAGLEAFLTESDRAPPRGCSAFDSLLGLAVHRRCAPILDPPADADPDAYVARAVQVARDRLDMAYGCSRPSCRARIPRW